MHKEDHNKSGDLKSLKLFAALLFMNGFETVEYGHRGDGYDMKGVDRQGREYLFNLKQRNIASDKYNDLMLTKADFESLQWARENNKDCKIAYVQIYKDGVVFITGERGWGEFESMCPTTTRFDNNEYIMKTNKTKSQNAADVKRIDLKKIDLNTLKELY